MDFVRVGQPPDVRIISSGELQGENNVIISCFYLLLVIGIIGCFLSFIVYFNICYIRYNIYYLIFLLGRNFII